MAKLLFITQKLDRQDSILGFTHRWLEVFAEHFETVTVICLQKGDYNLPQNVKVFSLGKERGTNKFKQLATFYSLIFTLREHYDSILVHMNPIYVVLGGLFWRLSRKNVFLWYLHPRVTSMLRLATILANHIVTADPKSFPLTSSKVVAIGHGIDTNRFRRMPEVTRNNDALLFLARISPIKRPELFLEALEVLAKQEVAFKANLVGDSLPGQVAYYTQLKNLARKYGLENRALFSPAVSNSNTAEIYNQHGIFVNLTPAGSFDKTILEAMACESLVVTTNRIFESIVSVFLSDTDSAVEIATKLQEALRCDDSQRIQLGQQARAFVVQRHDLQRMVLNFKRLC